MRHQLIDLGIAVSLSLAACTPVPGGGAESPNKHSTHSTSIQNSCFAQHDPSGRPPGKLPADIHGPFMVDHVADGDTITLDCGSKRIRTRLIGVDTPETVKPHTKVQCYGPQASAETKHLAPAGSHVWVELDASQGIHDRYGRALAYVWAPDGTLINKKLITDGYGREYTYYQSGPYKYQQQFKKAQTKARNDNRGLWEKCENGESQ